MPPEQFPVCGGVKYFADRLVEVVSAGGQGECVEHGQ